MRRRLTTLLGVGSCGAVCVQGFEVTYLPVQKNGLIDMAELEAAMRPDTAIVSIMAVNNEIGVVQPLKEIGELCRSKKIFFHTDAAQAVRARNAVPQITVAKRRAAELHGLRRML